MFWRARQNFKAGTTFYVAEVIIHSEMAEAGRRSRTWCITWHDHSIDDINIPVSKISYAVFGNEKCPQTGRAHVQGYIVFSTRVRFSTVKNYFDQTVHLSIARGTPQQNLTYCSKENDYVTLGDINSLDLDGGASGGKQKAKNSDLAYSEAIKALTVQSGLEIIKEKRPRDFCLHGEAIERNLKRSKTVSFSPQFSLTDFTCSPLVLTKSTLLYGPSNTGKTSFACSHFHNPLVVSHIDKLKRFSPDNDGIIFDDMSFKHWPTEAVIHLLDFDHERDLNVRYGTVTIPAKTIKIFTHNDPNPFYNETISEEQKEAIERRLNRSFIPLSIKKL